MLKKRLLATALQARQAIRAHAVLQQRARQPAALLSARSVQQEQHSQQPPLVLFLLEKMIQVQLQLLSRQVARLMQQERWQEGQPAEQL